MNTFAQPTLLRGSGSGIVLRDYQEDAKRAVLDYIAQHPKGRPAVQIPTGGGKTVVFASIAKEIGYPVLVLAHRDELLDQAAEKFHMVDPGVSVGKVKAATNQPWAEVVVASMQTLAVESRLQAMPKHFKLIIVDEAHHINAPTYKKILTYFKGTPVLGVSATLERGNGGGLEGMLDELVYRREMLQMIEDGYLCDLRAAQIQLKDFNASRVRMNAIRRDFADGALGDALSDAGAPAYALKAYLEHAPERKAIAFTPTVALAQEFADTFNEGGVSAAMVSGETPRTERQSIYRKLRSGEIRVVANAMVLTEGFDEPSVDCIIAARPTTSRSLFIQMVGRGLRLHPGKADCLVLDMVGNTDRVRLVTIPNLFEVPEETWRDGMTVTQNRRVIEEEAEQQQINVDRDIEAISVDLFTQRKFNWVQARGRTGETRYVLAAGDGMVILTRNDHDGHELYDVRHEKRNGETVEIASQLDLGYAQGAAEDYVRKDGAAILNAKDAAWRRKPASEKQVGALAKWGVQTLTRKVDGRTVTWLIDDPDEELTAGRASDLLTERIARRKPAAKKAA